jgi:hypothetical protein
MRRPKISPRPNQLAALASADPAPVRRRKAFFVQGAAAAPVPCAVSCKGCLDARRLS